VAVEREGRCRLPRSVLLSAIALLLVLPKLMLVVYTNAVLWGSFGVVDTLLLISQDLVLAALVFCALTISLRRPTGLRLVVLGVVTLAILLLLLIDARVRQLWLRPLSWDLVGYFSGNASDLTSGFDIFFKQNAGLRMTFRKWVFLAVVFHVAFWVITIWHLRGTVRRGVQASRKTMRLPLGVGIAAAVAPTLIAANSPRYLYGAERNIFVEGIISPFRSYPANAKDDDSGLLAESCDQKLSPLTERISQRPILFAGPIPPFRNVVILILESVRWRGLGIDSSGDTVAPTLRRLASEGTLAKCYVSVPHSSKSQFAILTGRHPYPGIEIREAMRDRFPSILWSLREQRDMNTFCFSVQHLLFENTDGMLKACGIERRLGPRELRALTGGVASQDSSFGESDELLLGEPQRMLAACNAPFAAVILTLAAHYPYDYPGKGPDDGSGIASYWKSIAYLDSILARLLDSFRECGLLNDTLFVLVGDHGESFGEHGTFIHNNSMYEEDVAVPLVFWSEDGRLRYDRALVARQIDIAPSIADLLGIDDDKYLLQGCSVFRKNADEPIYISSFFDNVSSAIVTGEQKFIWYPSQDQLIQFDLHADSAERGGIKAGDAICQKETHRLRAFIAYQKQMISSSR
jgi:hypothetical protein